MTTDYENRIRAAHDVLRDRFEERIHDAHASMLGQGAVIVLADPDDARGARTLRGLGVRAACAVAVAVGREDTRRVFGPLADKIDLMRLQVGPAGFAIVVIANDGISVNGWKPIGEGGGEIQRTRRRGTNTNASPTAPRMEH